MDRQRGQAELMEGHRPTDRKTYSQMGRGGRTDGWTDRGGRQAEWMEGHSQTNRQKIVESDEERGMARQIYGTKVDEWMDGMG